MRKAMMALAAMTAFCSAMPATAQVYQDDGRDQRRDDRRDNRDARQDYREDRRDDRQDYREDRRYDRRDNRQDARRDWREYRRYDYNRLPQGARGYYADQYYRDGRYYQQRRLSRNDRIYRGNDGRYYCRRNDGTTGLIIGGAAGGLLGNTIAPGGSKTLGTILGAVGGAAIGNSVGRGQMNCR